MKKALAYLLAFVMVATLIAGIIPQANAADAAGFEKAPFFGLGWSDIDRKTFENCEGLVTIGIRPNADDEVEIYKDDRKLGTDQDKLAQWVKEQMDALPEGARYLHVYGTIWVAGMDPVGVIDMSAGFDKAKPVFEAFIKKCSDLGVKLDGLVFDCEYMRMRYYEIYQQEFLGKGNNLVYQQIVDTDRYKNVVRPMLEERGFKFWPEVTEYTPEIYGIYPNSGNEYENSRAIWNRVMRNLLNGYLDEALYEPALKYYPDLHANDYQSRDSYTWLKELSDGGLVNYTAGNDVKVGDTSNFNTYCYRPGEAFFTSKGETIYRNPVGYNDAVYPNQPFYMCLWDANLFKNIQAATDTGRMSLWVGAYDYNEDDVGSAASTPYYTEIIYHIGMQNPEPFLIWIYSGYYSSAAEYNKRIKVVSEILDELTRVAGYSDRKTLNVPADWNSKYVLSGMYAGGRNIWRLTPDTSIISKENFQVKGASDPTFSVNGKTITFPGGKIIEDGKISEVGTCGFWIETAADVNPIVTNDADRYSAYPSFGENFEQYKVGDEFNYITAKPSTAWEFKKSKGSTILIQENEGDKVLALTGDVTVQNVKLPQNISAGDSYAKQQIWEVSFTLPKDLPAEAEVQLLTCAKKDNGIKIAGGKLYYDQAGEYQEMKGVNLTGGEEYTVRREVDFRTEGAYTCDYYVFDASGKQLGNVNDVPMIAELKLPVETITVALTDNFGTNTLLVDDYKLYPTGVATDFETYDANSGFLLTEADAVRDEAVAYRLSWMNASDKTENATIVAEFYDGDKLIATETVKELAMEPGCDGVETGIVELKADSTSVKVYLDNGVKTVSIDPTLIVLIAVIVVVLALIVAAFLVPVKKKPAAEEAAAPAEAEEPVVLDEAEAEMPDEQEE